MKGVPPFIIDRALTHFDRIDPAYGAGIRKALAHGGDAEVDLDLVDVLVEADEPVVPAAPARIDDEAAPIGERVAARVGDGATLQAGIGAVPDAALRGLVDRRGLAERSLADPTPPAWSQWWFGSHPTVLVRVALAEQS